MIPHPWKYALLTYGNMPVQPRFRVKFLLKFKYENVVRLAFQKKFYSKTRMDGHITIREKSVLYHPLLSPSPPPIAFFVTITYIEEIERFFLVLVVFIYSLIQNRLYEIVGHFTVFVPSLCWCRRFDKLTVITTLRGRRDSPDAVNKKHSVEVS